MTRIRAWYLEDERTYDLDPTLLRPSYRGDLPIFSGAQLGNISISQVCFPEADWAFLFFASDSDAPN